MGIYLGTYTAVTSDSGRVLWYAFIADGITGEGHTPGAARVDWLHAMLGC